MKAIAQSAKSAFHHDPPSFFSPCTSGSAMRQVAEVRLRRVSLSAFQPSQR
jgi:hypothetical protein